MGNPVGDDDDGARLMAGEPEGDRTVEKLANGSADLVTASADYEHRCVRPLGEIVQSHRGVTDVLQNCPASRRVHQSQLCLGLDSGEISLASPQCFADHPTRSGAVRIRSVDHPARVDVGDDERRSRRHRESARMSQDGGVATWDVPGDHCTFMFRCHGHSPAMASRRSSRIHSTVCASSSTARPSDRTSSMFPPDWVASARHHVRNLYSSS